MPGLFGILMEEPTTAYYDFKVVDTVDANQPALMSPAHYKVEIQKNVVVSHFLTSIPHLVSFRLSVDIPRRGFCVGENIPLICPLNVYCWKIVVIKPTVPLKLLLCEKQPTVLYGK